MLSAFFFMITLRIRKVHQLTGACFCDLTVKKVDLIAVLLL